MGDIDISVDVDLKQKNKNIGKQIAEDVAKGVKNALVSFGIVSNKKEGGSGLSQAAVMGAVAGGMMKLVDFVGGIVADWPPVVAAMKLLKAIILTLLLPLVPILRPVLLLLALLVKGLMKLFGPKGIENKQGQAILDKAGIKATAPPVTASPINVIKNLIDFFKTIDWASVGNAIKDFVIQGWENLKNIGSFIKDNIIIPAWNGIKGFGMKIWNDIIKPGFELLKSAGFKIWGEIITPGWEFLKTVGMKIWSEIIQPGWNFIAGVGQKIWSEILQPAFNWLSDVGTKIWNILKSPFETLAKQIADVFNWIKSVVRNLIGWGSVNDGIVQNGKIITTHPDDYIVATKDPASLGGKGGITININNAVVRDDRDIDALVKKISMELQKSYRGRISYV